MPPDPLKPFLCLKQLQISSAEKNALEKSVETMALRSVAYAGFFNGGGSVTSRRDDVKMLHYNYSSLEVLKCIVL